jgi:hypothetical protein
VFLGKYAGCSDFLDSSGSAADTCIRISLAEGGFVDTEIRKQIMLTRKVLGCLLAVTFVAANGCCTMGPATCGGGCGDCVQTKGAACTSCGPGVCGQPHLLGGLFGCLSCGSGCGQTYYDEWASDPPAACEPCDHHGNWLGSTYYGGNGCDAGCGTHCGLLNGLHHLWGYRFGSDGCASCGDPVWSSMPAANEPVPAPPETVTPPKPEPDKVMPAMIERSVRHASYVQRPRNTLR